MFFLHNLERRVTLHPSYLGPGMKDLVATKLLQDVEGTCDGDYYIISIMDAFEISEGEILPGSGQAEFIVGYRAVVWRPFKGETVRDVVPREGSSSWLAWTLTGGRSMRNRLILLFSPSTTRASSPPPDR